MKPFDDIPDKLTPQERKRIDARARKAAEQMGLDELRRARRMSQEALAETMHTTQAHVSRLERRADVYISTLRRYIEALGGELRIIAKFGKGTGRELEIEQFADLERRDDVPAMASGDSRILVSYLDMSAFGPPPKKRRSPRKAN